MANNPVTDRQGSGTNMQPTRLEKVAAHAEHLLEAFLVLKAKYAMLRPMLLDDDVVEQWAAGNRAWGFQVLRNTSLMSCILDVSKIAAERDDRSPSLLNLVEALDDTDLLGTLEDKFSEIAGAAVGDRQFEEAELREIESREEDERRQAFKNLVANFRERWAALESSDVMRSIGTVRDKLLAHNELRYDGEEYRPLDIRTLGLKYSDLDTVVDELETLIDLSSSVFRGASFAFDMLDKQLAASAGAFWNP